MQAMTIFALLLWLSIFSTAPQQPGTEKIGGTVTRADTTMPLPHARLELVREEYVRRPTGYEKVCKPQPETEVTDERLVVTADVSGKFTFENIVPGRYYLIAEHDGFLRTAYGQRGLHPIGTVLTIGPQAEAVPIEPGIVRAAAPSLQLQALQISLVPAPTIAGKVLSETGQPLAAATVQAYEFRHTPMNGRMLRPIRSALTDDEGRYRLFWLAPGRYMIAAGYSEHGLQPWRSGLTLTPNLPNPDAGYPVSFFPAAAATANAVPIRLEPGTQPIADLRLAQRLRFAVRIRLVSEQPLRDATLILVPAGGDLCAPLDYGIPATNDGTFEVRDVPEGIYIALAMRGRDVISEATTLKVDRDLLEAVEIPVSKPTEVRGNVSFNVIPQGIDISTIRVNLTRTGQELSQVASGVVNPSTLRFSIPGVGPGSYYSSLDLPSGFYVHNIAASKFDPQKPGNCSPESGFWNPSYTYMDLHGHLNPASPLRIPAVIPNGAECLAIMVRYGYPIAGFVRDRSGRAAIGALVVAVPKSVWTEAADGGPTPPDRYLTASTDHAGRFTSYGATECVFALGDRCGQVEQEYHLYAFEDINPNMLYDPGFTARFRGRESFVLSTEVLYPLPARVISRRDQNTVSGLVASSESCPGDLGTLRRLCILTVIPAEESAGNP
jgi:protocatechuate 3,4-dioxygenase beta subunit